jgi:hypothetical protein
VHAVAGVDGVEVAVHPAAEEAGYVSAVGVEVEGYRESVFVEGTGSVRRGMRSEK